MKLLLDTNALLWFVREPEILRRATYDAIVDPANDVRVSMASIWEAAIKAGTGKLALPADFMGSTEASGLTLLDITARHALKVVDLPRHHRDPFDRLLIAQAMIEELTLATRDATLPLYGVPILGA